MDILLVWVHTQPILYHVIQIKFTFRKKHLNWKTFFFFKLHSYVCLLTRLIEDSRHYQALWNYTPMMFPDQWVIDGCCNRFFFSASCGLLASSLCLEQSCLQAPRSSIFPLNQMLLLIHYKLWMGLLNVTTACFADQIRPQSGRTAV